MPGAQLVGVTHTEALQYFLMALHLVMSVYLLVWQTGNYGQHFGEYYRFFSVNCRSISPL